MTRIIQRLTDGVVLYAGDDLTLDTSGAAGGDWRDPSTTSDNAQLVEGVALPTPWTGGAYTFDGSSFAVHDAALLAPAAAAVPASVSRRQGMAVLIKYGIDTQIDALLQEQLDAANTAADAAAILRAKLAINDWRESTAFQRNWPLIEAVRQVKGWTSAYVDGLFIEARGL